LGRAEERQIEPGRGQQSDAGDSMSSPAVRPSASPSRRSLLRRATHSYLLRQAGLFALSNIVVSLLAIVSTALLARNLRTTEFGSYSFAVAFLTFVAMVFEFGFFAPAARITAFADRQRQRDIVGAALLLYVPIGAAFCIA